MQLRQVGKSYLIYAYICAKDILYKSIKCANCIKLNALHVTINFINIKASLKVVKLVKLLIK
jgi:hypothetical protein